MTAIQHEIRHGELKIYVTAAAGMHHSTIAAEVWRYVKALEQPVYVSSVTGARPVKTRPGKWCRPVYSGPWRRVGSHLEPDNRIRKTFTSWPVPHYTED
jgi:hypothetical protein